MSRIFFDRAIGQCLLLQGPEASALVAEVNFARPPVLGCAVGVLAFATPIATLQGFDCPQPKASSEKR